MALQFHKATKEQALLRLGLVAPSGGGKTWTALTVACEIARLEGGRVALIDTEHGSAAKYADRFDFDTLLLEDCSPRHYVEAIEAAENADYSVVVIDSATHAWDAILDEKDRKSKGGNTWAGWSDLSPKYRAFVEKQVRCKTHLIATMRAKTTWVLEEKNGKQVPRKVGMGAAVRPGYEYEYDIVGYLDLDHDLTIEKTRYEALDGKTWQRPDEKFAVGLYQWLRKGVERTAPTAKPQTPPAPQEPAQTGSGLRLEDFDAEGQARLLHCMRCVVGYNEAQARRWLANFSGTAKQALDYAEEKLAAKEEQERQQNSGGQANAA